MIPAADVTPTVPSPIPTCVMPTRDEISEEGFGWFRGTWFIGGVSVRDAEAIVRHEAKLIEWLDRVSSQSEDFELMASVIESADVDGLPDRLRARAVASGIGEFIALEDGAPLDGLEIGVSGLAHALSAISCLTAASCRSHASNHSWSDAPVVFFAAPTWRVEILAGLISSAGCGLDEDRGMLTVYARSIRDTHRLAERILVERGRFRKRPAEARTPPPHHTQMDLFSDSESRWR
jgi:hypothetical protein